MRLPVTGSGANANVPVARPSNSFFFDSSTFMLRAQVFTAIRWTASARMLSQFFTWVITLIVIRLLTPADYGLLAMATIFLSLLVMVADVGMGPALVQRQELGERELRQAFGIALALHLALAVALALAAPLISRFFEETELVPIVRVLSVQLVIGAFGVIPDAVLQRQLEFRKRSLLDLAATVTGSLVTLALALTGQGVWALVLGSMTSQALRVVGVNLLTGCLTRPEFSLTGTRSLLQAGGQATLSQIIWFLFNQADRFIAGKLLGKEVLGYYSVALDLAALPNQKISPLINQVAFPSFSRMQHDVPRVAANTLLGVRLLCIVAFPVLWGISSVAPEIVSALLGSTWIASILPLQILALVMPLRMISTFVTNPVHGLGRFDVGLANNAVAFLVMATAYAVGVQWGLVGLCLAWLIGSPLVFIENMRRYMAVMRVPLHLLLASMARPAVAASVMYGVVAGCRTTVLAHVTDLTRLALLIPAGVLAYLVTSLFLNRRGLTEALDLFRGIMGKHPHDAAQG